MMMMISNLVVVVLIQLFFVTIVIVHDDFVIKAEEVEKASVKATIYTGCSPEVYYADISSSSVIITPKSNNINDLDSAQQKLYDELQNLVTVTHRNVLPNIAQSKSEADIVTALADLYPGDSEDTVDLIYRQVDMKVNPANTIETWKREDLWPIERGASRNSPALTDVHVKAPADWTVLDVKSSLFFGSCGTVEFEDDCSIPANVETPIDTAQDSKVFTPPKNVRGDIARALFYNQLRYQKELGLTLTDCPPFSDTEFGYLSELLRWHIEDPPSDVEKLRNERICTHWQGNRNVFIDYPDLVADLFGEPDTIREGTRSYMDCTVDTDMPTATPNECSAVQPGDIFPYVFNTEAPDQIVFYPLDEIPASVGSIYVTDKAWNGTDLADGEGTVEYKIPDSGIDAGVHFAYGVDLDGTTEDGIEQTGEWIEDDDDGLFDLGPMGDNIFVYCLNADGLPHFISGIIYGNATQDSKGWSDVDDTLPNNDYGFDKSALPPTLQEQGNVVLGSSLNFRYDGPGVARKAELLEAFGNAENWIGSDLRYEIATSNAHTTNTITTTTIIAAIMTTFYIVVCLGQ